MSTNFLDNKIIVIVNDTPNGGISTEIKRTSFKCNTCKHYRKCNPNNGCQFATYLTHKLPTTKYSLQYGEPTVEIYTQNPDQATLDAIEHTIERAKRLRMAGQLKGYYKKK